MHHFTKSHLWLRRPAHRLNYVWRHVLLRWVLAASVASHGVAAWGQRIGHPDLGPNVLFFDPAQSQTEMQALVDRVYAAEQHAEFGSERYAMLFMPGEYKIDVPIGYYTEVRGVGETPDAVHIRGNVHVDASLPNNNATCVFWRGIENLAVTPSSGTMQWAVSQAVPMRRVHVDGNLVLHQKHGWASGGWMADTEVDGTVDSGTQQQWISRNSDWSSWSGSNWNMVFVGVPHAPPGTWPTQAYTEIAQTPVIREKPYLQVNATGAWSVYVPGLRRNSAGVSWTSFPRTGRDVPLDRFYIARPERDTSATINAELMLGRNLLLTPGIYHLTEPIRVTKPDTVVLGLGFATLQPSRGTPALVTADVDNLTLSGLLVDAGPELSPVLMQIGPRNSHIRHRERPSVLHDIFSRDGGAGAGKTIGNLEVNASNTIIDHTWIWRADHGQNVGWNKNLSQNGLVVNGDDVIAYGLFVEHHQEFQVMWNGERGRTYLYQSEIPYDPPTQSSYTSGPGSDGWASYKVGDAVQQHQAWGLSVYSVFTYPDVFLSRAIEAPRRSGVRFDHMITTCLNTHGAIRSIIDDDGGAATCRPRHWPRLTSFPPAAMETK